MNGSVQFTVEHFFTMDTSHFTATQHEAYNRTVNLIRQGRRPDEPRILGLFTGLIEITDDFDTPLPDEETFWGKHTNEYGIHLEP